MTVGVLAPIGAALFAPGTTRTGWIAAVGSVLFVLAAIRPHLYAKHVLKGPVAMILEIFAFIVMPLALIALGRVAVAWYE